jgi:hypothetical protein
MTAISQKIKKASTRLFTKKKPRYLYRGFLLLTLRSNGLPARSFLLACWSLDLIGCLAVSYSHMANATLPSALQRFTSVFGMGTGGSTALLPPGINHNLKKLNSSLPSQASKLLGCCMVKPHG